MCDVDYDSWFEANYLKYLGKALKIAIRRLGNVDLAQEAVHEAFIVLWSSRQTVIQHPNIEGFIMKTLNNKILHIVRHLSYQREEPLGQSGTTTDKYIFDNIIFFPENLSNEERQLLLWHYVQEVPCAKIAKRLGISENACRVRIFRAKQHYISLYMSHQDEI